MDEDIDIEEHDILENPRLKNILPHFDSIKEEPLDYEDNYEEYSYNQFEDMQEEDEGSDASVAPEYSNRITLGSKPNANSCGLKYLTVFLEDWGPRLARSSCFCKDCNILFATRNSLDAHNMAAHSFLVAMDSPTESPNDSFEDKDTLNQMLDEVEIRESHKFCNHCQKYFSDDNVLIQHLYDLITAKQAKVQGKSIVMNQPTVPARDVEKFLRCPICSYQSKIQKPMRRHLLKCHNSHKIIKTLVPFDPKCKFCPLTSSSAKSLNKHIAGFHQSVWSRKVKNEQNLVVSANVERPVGVKCPKCPKMYASNVAVRVHIYKAHVANKAEYKKVPPNRGLAQIVSRSYLFKCNGCPVHFLTCVQGIQHVINGNHTKDVKMATFECDKCKLTLRLKDRSAHELQHEFNSVFKVLVLSNGLNKRVMCKCPICCLYFEELSFLRHSNRGCDGSTLGKQCFICEKQYHNYRTHMMRHNKHKLSKSDLIFIDDYIFSEISGRNAVTPGVVQDKKKKKHATLFYCHNCNCFHRVVKGRWYHKSGDCKTAVNKIHCTVCGLKVNQAKFKEYHMVLHESHKLQLKDFFFRHILDSRPVAPPLPTFLYCAKCGIASVNRSGHTCAQSSKSCSICKIKFDLQTYKLHMLHHKYLRKELVDEPSDTLRMKYDMLKPTWHILFDCSVCGVATDSYDNVIDHCQKHFSNMESYDVIINTCDVCALKFDNHCYAKHKKLHANQDITKGSFDIVTYNYQDLFKQEWFKMFSSLPEGETRQITSHSIYVTRFVKMKLVVNGPPELTIYKCEICGNVVPPADVFNHAKCFDECSNTIDRFNCEACGLVFGTMAAKNEHVDLHATKDVSKNSFRVVAFNSVDDKEFNERLIAEFNDSPWLSKVDETDIKTYKNVKSNLPTFQASKLHKADRFKYKYYQCQKCKCCSSKWPKGIAHVCSQKKFIQQCAKCKYLFNNKAMVRHRIKHEESKNLTRANMLIIPYIGTKLLKKVAKPPILPKVLPKVPIKPEAPTPPQPIPGQSVIFKCVCGLHFPSKQTIVQHGTVCSRNKKESSANCSRCGLRFPPDLLVTHLVNHHRNGDSQLKVIEVPILFKCKHCKCLFMKRQSLLNHQRCCEGFVGGTKCEDCDLFFHNSAFAAHQETHSKRANEERPKIILYKCERCYMHFPNQVLGSKHMRNHYIERSKVCKKCNHLFLLKHMKFHIEQKCSKADISIQVLTDQVKMYTKSNKKRLSDVVLNNEGEKHKDSNKERHSDVVLSDKGEIQKESNKKRTSAVLSDNGENKETVKKRDSDVVLDKEVIQEKYYKKRVSDVSKRKQVDSIDDIKDTYDESEVLETIVKGDMTLFKCKVCDIHFCNYKSFDMHSYHHQVKRAKMTCDDCGRGFTKPSLLKHNATYNCKTGALRTGGSTGEKNYKKGVSDVSKRKQMDSIDDIKDTYDESEVLETIIEGDMTLFKCKVCDIHFCNYKSFDMHSYHHQVKRAKMTCDDCGRGFTKPSLLKHNAIHNCKTGALRTGESTGETPADPISATPESKVPPIVTRQSIATTSKQKSYNVKLYKCGECNVHFMTQNTCYKHILNHKPLDITDFIACKICSLQFRISSLTNHVKTHHASAFDIDKVLVEEYKIVKGGPPKIDIFYAGDKLQSKLVSTTTNEQEESPKKDSGQTPVYVDDVMVDSKNESVSYSDDMDVNSVSKTDDNLNTDMEVETSTEKDNSIVFDSTEDISVATAIDPEFQR